MPRIVHEVANANVSAAHHLQQIAGPELREFGERPESLFQFATKVSRSAKGVSTYMSPPRIKIKTTEIGDPAAHRPTVAEMLFPGIVLLVILMMSAGMSLEIWKDASAHAPRRVAATPSSLAAFLGGKVSATAAVLLVAIAVTFAAGRAAFHVPMRAVPMALLWSAGSAVVVYCGLMVVQLLLASERTSTTVAGMFLVPMAMLGGSFFPMESMPESFARVAAMTPNGWMLVRLKSILTGQVPRAELLTNFAILLAAAAILFAFTRRLMERRFVA